MRKPRSAAADGVLLEVTEESPDPYRVALHARVERDGDPTVGEQLHRAHSEPVVAVTGGRAGETGGVLVEEQRRGMGHSHDVDGQCAGPGHPRVQRLRLRGARRVVHAGDALGEQRPRPGGDVLGPAVGIHEVAQRPGVGLAPRLLDEDAGGVTASVAPDLPRERVGSVTPDAEGVEPGGADDALVQRVVGDDHRPIDPGGVEVVAGDSSARSHEVEPLAAHPHGGGPSGRLRPDGLDQRIAVAQAVDVVPMRMQRGHGEVVVGVDQAGHQHRAREIDHLGDRRVGLVQKRTVPDGNDPLTVDEHDFRRGTVHGEDSATPERTHGSQPPDTLALIIAPSSWPRRRSGWESVRMSDAMPPPQVSAPDYRAAIQAAYEPGPQASAAVALATAMRSLNRAIVGTTASDEVLAGLTAEINGLVDRLAPHARPSRYEQANAISGTGTFANHPMIGPANPCAPRIAMRVDGDRLVGEVMFTTPQEGPPGYGYGGYLAAGFDAILLMTAGINGHGGPTKSLTVRYRRPTPLHTPLRYVGEVEAVEERVTRVTGRLEDGAGTVYVEGEAEVSRKPIAPTTPS